MLGVKDTTCYQQKATKIRELSKINYQSLELRLKRSETIDKSLNLMLQNSNKKPRITNGMLFKI
jgi:hypothetical protein